MGIFDPKVHPSCVKAIEGLESAVENLRRAAEELPKPKTGDFFRYIWDSFEDLKGPSLAVMDLEDFTRSHVSKDISSIRHYIASEFGVHATWDRSVDWIPEMEEIAEDLLDIAAYINNQCESGKWPDPRLESTGGFMNAFAKYVDPLEPDSGIVRDFVKVAKFLDPLKYF